MLRKQRRWDDIDLVNFVVDLEAREAMSKIPGRLHATIIPLIVMHLLFACQINSITSMLLARLRSMPSFHHTVLGECGRGWVSTHLHAIGLECRRVSN